MKTVSVVREGRRWYVILACDEVPAEPLPSSGSTVGIDLGTVHFLTDSSGHHVPNPTFLAQAAGEPAAAQQHLAGRGRLFPRSGAELNPQPWPAAFR
ncbi:hypothetical protein BEN35_29555 [Streptomyces fradiae]|nr:hypothetical protein BEN35_29555 [Streptomyces fradiae]